MHVDDAARGIAAVMAEGRPGETYHLAGESPRMGDRVRRCASAAGRRVRLALPGWLVRVSIPLVVLLERMLPWPAHLSVENLGMAAGDELAATGAKAEAELGWRPARSTRGCVAEHELVDPPRWPG